MNSAIRWRIHSLQAMLFVILAGAGAFALYEGTFVTNQVHDELVAQQISFPAADQIKTGGALDPAEFPKEIRDQAGNQVTDGNQARIYANDFIGIHLSKIANGLTYATMGPKISALQAQQAQLSKTDPQYAALGTQITTMQGQRTTLLNGEMLRGTLLNSYGWWQFGTYMTYAAYALFLAALVVLGALVFEAIAWARSTQTQKVNVPQKKAAGLTA
ncbi:MAG TPA: hypothetical protein VFR33_10345 [Candidatus Dormibacteraeota bacterium]|nr:hypothetical protein [Candidatus Dormibacteraeota bacterium]